MLVNAAENTLPDIPPRVLHLRRARLSSQAPLARPLARSLTCFRFPISFSSLFQLPLIYCLTWMAILDIAALPVISVCVGGLGGWWTFALRTKGQSLFAPHVPHSNHFHTDENEWYSLFSKTTFAKTGTEGSIFGKTSELLEYCCSKVTQFESSQRCNISSSTKMSMTNTISGCCCFCFSFTMTN